MFYLVDSKDKVNFINVYKEYENTFTKVATDNFSKEIREHPISGTISLKLALNNYNGMVTFEDLELLISSYTLKKYYTIRLAGSEKEFTTFIACNKGKPIKNYYPGYTGIISVVTGNNIYIVDPLYGDFLRESEWYDRAIKELDFYTNQLNEENKHKKTEIARKNIKELYDKDSKNFNGIQSSEYPAIFFNKYATSLEKKEAIKEYSKDLPKISDLVKVLNDISSKYGDLSLMSNSGGNILDRFNVKRQHILHRSIMENRSKQYDMECKDPRNYVEYIVLAVDENINPNVSAAIKLLKMFPENIKKDLVDALKAVLEV